MYAGGGAGGVGGHGDWITRWFRSSEAVTSSHDTHRDRGRSASEWGYLHRMPAPSWCWRPSSYRTMYHLVGSGTTRVQWPTSDWAYLPFCSRRLRAGGLRRMNWSVVVASIRPNAAVAIVPFVCLASFAALVLRSKVTRRFFDSRTVGDRAAPRAMSLCLTRAHTSTMLTMQCKQ